MSAGGVAAHADPACQAQIAQDLAPFNEQARSIWIGDRLFMYVEVADLTVSMIDRDERTRTLIERYLDGSAETAEETELRDRVTDFARKTAGYSDSLVKKYELKNERGGTAASYPFYWHYPAMTVSALHGPKVTLTLQTEVGELKVELKGLESEDKRQVMDAATLNLALRAGQALPHSGLFAPEYLAPRDYLSREGHPADAKCLEGLDASYGLMDLRFPESNPAALEKDGSLPYHSYSVDRAENSAVMGVPTTDYVNAPNWAGGSAPQLVPLPLQQAQQAPQSQAAAQPAPAPQPAATANPQAQ